MQEEMLQKLQNHLSEVSHLPKRELGEDAKEWISFGASLLGLPKDHLELYTQILSHTHLKVIWLHMEECSGCSESLLMNSDVGFERFVTNFLQIQYHDMLMANSGHQTKQTLKECVGNDPYILVVEGSISEEGDMFLTLGAEAHSGAHECRELAKDAKFVVAVGSCSSFGGIQIAHPNPTKAKTLSEIIGKPTINIAGCPPSDINICTTLLYLAITSEIPPLDSYNRPLWSYGKTVHDLCERKGAFGAGEFVQEFGDEGAKQGYCLYKVGCRGPYVYNNCGKVKFNSKTSWPIQAGHGCIGCSEPNFWDNMGNFEEPMGNNIPNLTPHSKYFPKHTTFQIIPPLESLKDFQAFCQNKALPKTLLLRLDFNAPTQIWEYSPSQVQDIAEISFQSNPKILFETLETKTKIGGKLAQNFYKAFPNKQNFLQSLQAQDALSDNLCDLFGVLCLIAGENRIYKNAELIELAETFKHPYASKYAMKFKANPEGKYNVDFSKFLNPFVSYAVGGLDLAGLCYGVIDSYAEAFGDIASQYTHIILSGEVFLQENGLFAQKFLQYGKTKTMMIAKP